MNKIIYNEIYFDWFNFNPSDLKKIFKASGIIPYNLDQNTIISESIYADINYNVNLDEEYLGIKLFDLSIYSICNELIIFKDELDIKKHSKIINKWFIISKYTLELLNNLFDLNKFSLALVVHGHLLIDACILGMAKKHNVPFLCFENTSNKSKIVWDNYTGKVITYNLSKQYFYNFKNYIKPQEIDSYVANFKKSGFKNKRGEHISNVENLKVPFKKPYVLYIGQVYNDAALLFALNGGFKNPIQVIEKLIDICKLLNVDLVIKLHPKEKEGSNPVSGVKYNLSTYRKIKKYASKNICIDYDNRYNTYKLIEDSAFVVTVNSQAGLEASLYNKPVVVYKNCFFSNLGFTYEFDSGNTLKETINYLYFNRINHNLNYDLAKTFFMVFFEKYCFKNTMQGFLNKIIKVELNKKHVYYWSLLCYEVLCLKNYFYVFYRKTIRFLFK